MRYREFSNLNEDAQRVESSRDQAANSRYSPEEDEVSGPDIESTRKPKLTLKMINRLKKIRSTKNLEMTRKQELLGIMYGLNGVNASEE
jgi:hypothetical protein